ncbi:MAG TPA: hypothetical protein VNV82_13215 [Bryobacteraceae bacterium]|jgi:hypothetical protein|nr:hypothetical protein [Bryobacteraceae bacterium]
MSTQRQHHKRTQSAIEPTPALPASIPEWLEQVRLNVEDKTPLMQTLIRRAINAVLRFAELSEASVVEATASPSDLVVLLRALSSGELLDDLRSFEPLAPAFIRGIETQRRLVEEHGGTRSAEQIAQMLGISRQAVDKRRRSHALIALNMGRHGYRYPVWQFTKTGSLPGLEDVLQALEGHDEWMQIAFFLGKNPRLGGETPVDMLKAGDLKRVVYAAQVYGEHGAA